MTRLIQEIPHMRIALIAHGDYCDYNSTYVSKVLDFTNDVTSLVNFAKTVEKTGGGDSPEVRPHPRPVNITPNSVIHVTVGTEMKLMSKLFKLFFEIQLLVNVVCTLDLVHQCYEWALREASQLDWSEDSAKALVVIGDDVPHPPAFTDQQVFWKTEMQLLKAEGIKVNSIELFFCFLYFYFK